MLGDLAKWPRIITAVKNRTTLFALIVLVVGSALGAVALRSAGHTQVLSVAGIIFLMTVLICVVFWLEYVNTRSSVAAAGPGAAQAGEVAKFCRSIEGNWWDRLTDENLSTLAIVAIEYQALHNTVHINGKSYNEDGGHVARWWSVAASIDLQETKVTYYFRGHHYFPRSTKGQDQVGASQENGGTPPHEEIEGAGDITFDLLNGRFDKGKGRFWDTNLQSMKGTPKKAFEYWRCTKKEAEAMLSEKEKVRGEMVRKKLGELRGQ